MSASKLYELEVQRLKQHISDLFNMAIKHPRFEEKFLRQAEEKERELNELTRLNHQTW